MTTRTGVVGKFVQIAAAAAGSRDEDGVAMFRESLYALDVNGRVWEYDATAAEWYVLGETRSPV